MNAFKFEDFLRNACQRGCAFTSISTVPIAINGVLRSDAAASSGFFANIMTTTAMTVRKSGISVVTQLFKTSFKELMSPMILLNIFPVGLESKN